MLDHEELETKIVESAALIDALTELTRSGEVSWDFTAFEPPMLLEADKPYISQKLTARTLYDGEPYLVEIYDLMDLFSENGETDVTIQIGAEPQNREEALERVFTFFPPKKAKVFSDMLFHIASGSSPLISAWNEARFTIQRLSPYIWKLPAAILGKQMFEQRQEQEFHRLCSDPIFLRERCEEQIASVCSPRSQCCCFTGHRPEKLTQTEEEVKTWLTDKVREAIRNGYTTFFSGMARGVDLWAAECVLSVKEADSRVRLICASPYNGFDSRWSKRWRNLYTDILNEADETVFVSPQYSPRCFQKRNEWMVDHSSRVIAIFNGTSGGTKNTVDYARKRGCEVIL